MLAKALICISLFAVMAVAGVIFGKPVLVLSLIAGATLVILGLQKPVSQPLPNSKITSEEGAKSSKKFLLWTGVALLLAPITGSALLILAFVKSGFR